MRLIQIMERSVTVSSTGSLKTTYQTSCRRSTRCLDRYPDPVSKRTDKQQVHLGNFIDMVSGAHAGGHEVGLSLGLDVEWYLVRNITNGPERYKETWGRRLWCDCACFLLRDAKHIVL